MVYISKRVHAYRIMEIIKMTFIGDLIMYIETYQEMITTGIAVLLPLISILIYCKVKGIE